jgi:peroxiredoxin
MTKLTSLCSKGAVAGGLERRLVGALVLALLAGCATTGGAGVANVPNLALQDVNGRTHYLSDYVGQKVVVMSFWATWCQPCRQELLMLEQVYREHKQEGLVVLGINTDGPETQAAVRTMVMQQGFTFPILLDTETRAVTIYNPRKQEPMMHIFARSGRIVFTHSTFQPGEAASIRARILAVLHGGTGDEPADEEKGKDKDKRDKKGEGEGEGSGD